MSWAVSASITSVIFTIWPCFISSLMTSTARSDMRLASSWMVIVSGIVTSRTIFSFCSLSRWPVMRCVRRRNEATERSRSSSALSAVTSVRRPRCFGAPARGAFGAGAGRTGAPPMPRRAGRRSSSSASGVSLRAIGAAGLRLGLFFLAAETLLGDFVGLALGLFVVAAAIFLVALARFGGLALGALDRIALGAALRLFLGDLAFLGLAHLGVAERVRAAVLLFLGQRAQHNAGRLRRGRGGGAGAAWRRARRAPRGTTPTRRGVAPRSRRRRGRRLRRLRFARSGTRRFTFSTTTALVRPWLKLCRTTPVSARGLSVSVLVELTLSVLSPGFSYQSFHSLSVPELAVAAASVKAQPRAIPCRVRPAQWSGSVRGSGSARETRCSLGRQAGQHVSHLTGPMPNPIARS